MNRTVYIAGPLFSKSELEFNLQLNELSVVGAGVANTSYFEYVDEAYPAL